ncbi:right-handed parallel beta-helix repeat-containing protein [Dyadobacter crusticola]|uniref:right-handed parallel beta-helix repeat-containing protein n=1 Tax=Dyadobacter crusticola TaxID=292407 RepID=UPI0004E21128|nr:right-handed parallel beta-helix repeat-containing protein [Dyadobacter crusticola]
MKNALTLSYAWTLFFVLAITHCLSASPKIDPIRFKIETNVSNVSLNEEFEITISAEYLNVSPTTAFVLKDANNFKLKLTLPEGFVKTGGDYHDYIGTELTPSRPKASYKLKGKFVSKSSLGVFELLRSHKNADNQSTFVAVGALTFSPQIDMRSGITDEALRISSVGNVLYLTIAEVQAGLAGTTEAIVITDNPRQGLFVYDASDTDTPDDGALVLVATASGRRYKRNYNGVVNAKWFGITAPDGITDEFSEWNDMLAKSNVRTVFFEKTKNPYRITGVIIPTEKSLIFEDGAHVKGTGNLGNNQTMFTISNGKNVKIVGKATFEDIKASYPSGEDGQFNGCIKVLGSENLLIEDITIKNTGGDGIYLGRGDGGTTNINARIVNVNIDNTNRNGITIITANGCWIDRVNIRNANGSAPANGIDIEPNSQWEVLKGIKITNLYTAGNHGGVLIALAHHSNSRQVADIVIDNHTDEGSINGFTIHQTAGNFQGSIVIKNPVWRNNPKSGLLVYNYAASGPRVDIYNPTVISAGSATLDNYTFRAAYMFYRHSDAVGAALLGNVHLHEPSIVDNRTPLEIDVIGFLFADGQTQTSNWTNCSIFNPKVIQILSPWKAIVGLNTALFPKVTDAYGVLIKDLGGNDITIRSRYSVAPVETVAYYRHLTNTTSTGLQTVTLHDQVGTNADVTIEVTAAQPIRINTITGWSLRPLAGPNTPIQSNVIGSKITLTRVGYSTTSWTIKEISGTWTDSNGNVLFGAQPSFNSNSATSAPTKANLNAAYGTLRAGTLVSYPSITGGGRDYRKLTDSSTSDWKVTVWSTGVGQIVP